MTSRNRITHRTTLYGTHRRSRRKLPSLFFFKQKTAYEIRITDDPRLLERADVDGDRLVLGERPHGVHRAGRGVVAIQGLPADRPLPGVGAGEREQAAGGAPQPGRLPPEGLEHVPAATRPPLLR